MIKALTSKDNPNVKSLAALIKNKKERDKTGFFVIEGARLCSDAANSGATITRAFVTKEARVKYPEQVNAILGKTKNCWEISEEIAHWVSDTKSPQGLFAVCESSSILKNNFMFYPNGSYIVLDNLQDPGNIGTMLRTALSLGIDGAIISSDSAELYSPKLLRASMGAVLKLPINITDNLNKTIDEIKQLGIKVYATVLNKNSQAANRRLFEYGSAVVFGNEGNGLSQEITRICNGSIVIPMSENAESLNVSVAAGIIMWEMQNGKVNEKE